MESGNTASLKKKAANELFGGSQIEGKMNLTTRTTTTMSTMKSATTQTTGEKRDKIRDEKKSPGGHQEKKKRRKKKIKDLKKEKNRTKLSGNSEKRKGTRNDFFDLFLTDFS